MGKLWINNELVDRLAMLQQTEVNHPGINQLAIEKDWWVTTLEFDALMERIKELQDRVRKLLVSD